MTVSVVTAVRNSRRTIEDCLLSVAAQTYATREHVVVDGLSTDGTREVLAKHRAKIDVLVSERDTGIYNALNKGIANCTGDVVGFLHADDVFAHGAVLAKVAAVFEDPNVDVAYGDLVYVSKVNTSKAFRYWKAGAFSPAQLKAGWMPPHPTLYVRRTIYARLGGFDETYRIAADYDSVLRIFSDKRLQAAYIPEVLVRMRAGGVSNSSLRNVVRKSLEDYRALRSSRVGGFGTLVLKNLRKIRQFVETVDG